MRHHGWMLGLLATALTACGSPPATRATGAPAPTYSVAQAWGNRGDIGLIRAYASGFLSYGTNQYRPYRAIDGNLNTEWASTDRQRAWLVVAFDRRARVDGVRIKTGPTGRSYYVVQLSNDGERWSDASGRLRNYSWTMETKDVNGAGRYMRILWFRNGDPDVRHLSVFEVEPLRGGGGGGWGGRDGDWRDGR